MLSCFKFSVGEIVGHKAVPGSQFFVVARQSEETAAGVERKYICRRIVCEVSPVWPAKTVTVASTLETLHEMELEPTEAKAHTVGSLLRIARQVAVEAVRPDAARQITELLSRLESSDKDT